VRTTETDFGINSGDWRTLGDATTRKLSDGAAAGIVATGCQSGYLQAVDLAYKRLQNALRTDADVPRERKRNG
jgi:hypothetical protein